LNNALLCYIKVSLKEELISKEPASDYKGYTPAQLPLVTQDYHDDGSGKSPRYYQLKVINKTIEAISKGQNRNLLVMATGTGKTYTAFQIIWRLYQIRVENGI
jgi:type I restriction enzyme R subunit